MDSDRLTADEYEEQYFGFSSTRFYYELNELIYGRIKTAITEMETGLLEYYQNENDKTLILQQTHALAEHCKEKTENILMEILPDIRQFFEIPKNVLLEEDCFQVHQCSDEEFDQLVDEIHNLEGEFKQLKLFEHLCNEELQCLQKLEPVGVTLDDIIDKMKKIKQDKIHIKQLNKVNAAHEEYLKYFQENMPDWMSKMQLCSIERIPKET